MIKSDVDQLQAIELDAFPELFPPTSFLKEYSKPNSTVLVAEIDHNLIPIINGETSLKLARTKYRKGFTGWNSGASFITGMLINWLMAEENHIISIGVRRGYRGLGIGKLLMNYLIESVITNSSNSITLEVRESNLIAISMYKTLKFKIVGKRKKYYSDNNEDALIMTLCFDQQQKSTNAHI